jgi:hypothetical protein
MRVTKLLLRMCSTAMLLVGSFLAASACGGRTHESSGPDAMKIPDGGGDMAVADSGACIDGAFLCDNASQCCSGICVENFVTGGAIQGICRSCRSYGESCTTAGGGCCSNACLRSGTCACAIEDYPCRDDRDCCENFCYRSRCFRTECDPRLFEDADPEACFHGDLPPRR